MKSALLLPLSITIVLARFGPSVRIDHKNCPPWQCVWPAITVGPGAPSSQPVYVAFEADSGLRGRYIMFQKSTNAGATWLPADALVQSSVRSSRCYRPDITTDAHGDIYVVYRLLNDSLRVDLVCCVRSTDGGATWSPPAQIKDIAYGDVGWARIAVDSAGNLFCAWNDSRTEGSRIWSSVSADQGETWSQNIRVDAFSDSLLSDCYQADVFVQPGTNHYLVAAQIPYDDAGRTWLGCYLYRSTDMGQTFQPGVRFDANNSYAGLPHVVADARHVVCDYTEPNCSLTVRTLYSQPDTWSVPHVLGASWQAGGLAISADGRVHAVRQARPPSGGPYYVYYASSFDYGVTWSDPEPANDHAHAEANDPDIAVDSAGNAYIVWRDVGSSMLWFTTNNPAAVAEQPRQPGRGANARIVSRYDDVQVEYQLPVTAHVRATLHDAVGRQVASLDAGEQPRGVHRLGWDRDGDGRKLSAGAYFVLLEMGKEQVQLKAVVR